MTQTVEAVNSMSLSKGNRIWWVVEANCVRSHPCAIRVQTFITMPGPFYHRYTIPRLILRRIPDTFWNFLISEIDYAGVQSVMTLFNSPKVSGRA